MKVLIADDDLISRRVLEATLSQCGYEVAVARDGHEAWNILGGPEAPPLAILDWAMPEADGPELCRRARANRQAQPTYLILLIPWRQTGDIVAAFAAGADDYLVKPFDRGELRARLQVGRRIVELQRGLADRVRELEAALARVQQLQGLLPICAWCKRIRDDQNLLAPGGNLSRKTLRSSLQSWHLPGLRAEHALRFSAVGARWRKARRWHEHTSRLSRGRSPR